MKDPEKEFKRQYVVTFLASYMASNYDWDCQNGHPNQPYNHQPVTDAMFLADMAWEQYQTELNNNDENNLGVKI